MARIEGEARLDQRQWTLVFQDRVFHRNLRAKGYFAGHETKEELRAGIAEEVRRLKGDVENGNGGVNLQSYLVSKPPRCSTKKTGLKRKSSSSVVSGKSIHPRGPGPGSPAHDATAADRPREEKSRSVKVGLKGVTSGRVRDVVPPGKLEDFRDSSAGVSTMPCASLTAEKKRQKIVAAAEPLLSGERTPEQLRHTEFRRLLPAAGSHSDHRSKSSSLNDVPVIQGAVDNFILHQKSKLVSITTLPVYIDGELTGGASGPETVYLVGTFGPDLLMFKQVVTTWRLMLDTAHKPRYLLRTDKGAWVKLLKAQDEYSEYHQDVLALGHFLNFAKKLPNATPQAAEMDLQRMCRRHSKLPSLDTLSPYIRVIRSFIEKDEEFARAPILRRVFPGLFHKISSPQTDQQDEWSDGSDTAGVKRKAGRLPLESESIERKEKRYKVLAKKDIQKPSNGERLKLQWDNVSRLESSYQDDPRRKDVQRKIFSQAELDVEDPPICVLCDDGGDLLYCDGPCHRHFHPTKESGLGSFCQTLGLTKAELKDMDKYYCPNCLHDQQQCFVCGELGSSTSKRPEVRCCDVPFCNRFFHVECAAGMVLHDWEALAEAIVNDEEELYCPRHCCSVCGAAEKKEPGMLVQCRRCPKAWHRACLTNFSQSMELETTIIWKHYDREFIYCRKHEIIPKLQTPKRDHVAFPVVRPSVFK